MPAALPPEPDSRYPPNGLAGSNLLNVLAQTTPARSRCAIHKIRLPFSVHTPADSPYGVLFAFVTASSGVRKVSTDSTGPKISSRAIRCDWLTPVNTVGANQKPLLGQLARRRPALRALGLAGGGQLGDLVELLARVDRADVGVLVERVAEPQGGQPPLEPVDHVLGHRLLHEQPRAGAADVPLVEEDAVDDPLDRLVDRRVVEDDVRRLAAELQRELLAGAGDRLADRDADLGRSGERDLVDARVGRPAQRRSRPRRSATLTTPGGRSACWQTCASSNALSGVVSAGLSTHVLPAASAGASFQAAISSGKFHGITWPATPSGRRRRAEPGVVELVGPARVVEEVRGRQRDVDVSGLPDRLAVVDRLEHGELTGTLLQDPRDPVQVLGPLGARHRPPDLLVARPRGRDRPVDVGRAGLGDLRRAAPRSPG